MQLKKLFEQQTSHFDDNYAEKVFDECALVRFTINHFYLAVPIENVLEVSEFLPIICYEPGAHPLK